MIAFSGNNYINNEIVSSSQKALSDNENKVLRMKKNDRMGGYVPQWSRAVTAKEQVTSRLALAEKTGAANGRVSGSALSYSSTRAKTATQENFSFADIIDMVNPLHHIPVAGSIYRSITGDDIKPISKIIGGGIYGGGAGAASGLVNVIIEEETGRDITGNIASLAFNNSREPGTRTPDHPEARLEEAARRLSKYGENGAELPGTTIAFADLGRSEYGHRYEIAAEGRTAGWQHVSERAEYKYLPPREEITEISFSEMPEHK
jgi:hypothetical protein